jgi:hypothetical protein
MLITPILADAGPSRLTRKSRAQLSFLLVVCLCPALKVLARVPTVPKRATLTLHYLRDITKASHDSGSARVAVGEAASAGGGRWVQHHSLSLTARFGVVGSKSGHLQPSNIGFHSSFPAAFLAT